MDGLTTQKTVMKKIFNILLLLLLLIAVIGCQKEPLDPVIIVEDCQCDIVVDVQTPSDDKCETDYSSLANGVNTKTSHYQPWNIPFVDTAKKLNINLPRYGQYTLWSAFGKFNNNDKVDYIVATGGGQSRENPDRGEIVLVIDDVVALAFENPQLLTRKISVIDLNSDGLDDIVLFGTGPDVGNSSGDITTVIYMNGNSYPIVEEIDQPSGYYHAGAVGKLTGDSIDILPLNIQAFTQEPPLAYQKYYTMVNGDWEARETNITNLHIARTYQSELYDFDGDGILDLILGGHEWEEAWMSSAPARVVWENHILKGLGDGQFDVDNPIVLPQIINWGVITDFDIYDIDRDGNVEIIITRTTGRNGNNSTLVDNEYYDGIKVQILKGNGFSWNEWQQLESPNIIGLPTMVWAHKTTIYDVNGDCLLDIIPESDKINAASFPDFNSIRGVYYEQLENGQFDLKYKQ